MMDKRLKLLNNLVCFEAAARHSSYSKAAAELFISQAAVSQQMRNLEQALQVQLFSRSGRNMLLTYEGECLLKACQSGFQILVDGLNSIQSQDIAGELTITSTQAFCALWVMPNIFDFYQQHPDINIKVLGSNELEDLQQKHIDLAIRFSTSTEKFHSESLTIECIGEDTIYPVCSTQLFKQASMKAPQDLLNQHLVSLADTSVTWDAWFNLLDISGLKVHKAKTQVTSSDLALSGVLNGHGVMFATLTMIKPYIETGKLVIPFKIAHPVRWKTYLVYPKNSAKRRRIDLFCNWVKSQLK